MYFLFILLAMFVTDIFFLIANLLEQRKDSDEEGTDIKEEGNRKRKGINKEDKKDERKK